MKKNEIPFFFFKIKRKLKPLLVTACLLTSSIAFSSENQSTNESNTNRMQLGTPASFLQKFGINESNKQQLMQHNNYNAAQASNALPSFTLLNNSGEEIQVNADNFSLEVDGTLSTNGKVVGSADSEFILQGNEKSVYGWVILRDQDIAYEYKTEGDKLVVDKVKITDVHPVCNLGHHNESGLTSSALPLSALAAQSSSAATFAAAPHIGSYPGTHVGKLESKPGSSYVIWLDTRKVMGSDGVPYDVSKEYIWTTWQITAAGFSMFDVNVTTNKAVYDSAAPSKRGGGTMYRETGRSSCAFAFGTSRFCTLYRQSNAYGEGRTAVHEFGHLVHLAHDGGQPGGEYFNGIPEFQWIPIMGNYWPGNNWSNALYQWSKGEYSGASNRQDDFAKMTTFFPYRQDDISGTKALVVDANGNVSADKNVGQIGRNTDSDSFSFTIGASGGNVNFTIDRIEHIGGAMLDVQAYIKDSSGNIVAQSNKSVNRSASFNRNLSAGNYTLEITGGAEGTPSHGFSKYSSLGYYAIEGSISGSDTGGDTPAITNIADGATLSGTSQLFKWTPGNADGFWFYAGSTSGAKDYYTSGSTVTGTSHTVTGLPTDGSTVHVTFWYQQNGSWSKTNHTYVASNDSGCTSAPNVPNNPTGTVDSSTGFTANWNSVNTATSYTVQLWVNGAWKTIGTTDKNNYKFTGLTAGSTQYVRVSAKNSCGSSNYSGWTKVVLSGSSCDTAPSVPTGLTGNSQTISWNAVSGASSYDIQIWSGSAWADHASTSSTTYTLGLSGTQYTRIRAVNSCGKSSYSGWITLN
ncbi:hypothetical protein [Aliikangiella sp. IMCC44359]|uniref:hypothetical protein n=1 Tax=Aliikangiella sp. IMCC44359 TaxID=3459125 RepID=UPI00403AEBDC